MLSDSQWDKIKTIIEPKPRKRVLSLRVVVSGVVYLLNNGCKWRSLPPVYGHYKNVWYYYHKWMVYGVLEALLYDLSKQVRLEQGRQAEPSMVIVDSQSVKTVAGTREHKGFDGGKKVRGRKRHMAVDTQGNVMAVGVTAANVHDRPGSLSMKEQIEDLGRVRKILADGSYKGEPVFTAAGRIEWEIVERKATGGKFKVIPRRWVVERTFGWLNNYRRLSKDYEKTVIMSKAMIIMSAVVITLNKLVT